MRAKQGYNHADGDRQSRGRFLIYVVTEVGVTVARTSFDPCDSIDVTLQSNCFIFECASSRRWVCEMENWLSYHPHYYLGNLRFEIVSEQQR